MSDEQIQVAWRIKLGFALFIISIGWPVVLPFSPLFGVSGSMIAAFVGAMLLVSEVMIIAGAAISGKEGFTLIKSKVFGFLKLNGSPKKVEHARYVVGLMMFVLPLVLGWALPYVGGYFPGYQKLALYYAIAVDALIFMSLFVLGGEFWDKLRSLFMHDAYAVIREKASV